MAWSKKNVDSIISLFCSGIFSRPNGGIGSEGFDFVEKTVQIFMGSKCIVDCNVSNPFKGLYYDAERIKQWCL